MQAWGLQPTTSLSRIRDKVSALENLVGNNNVSLLRAGLEGLAQTVSANRMVLNNVTNELKEINRSLVDLDKRTDAIVGSKTSATATGTSGGQFRW